MKQYNEANLHNVSECDYLGICRIILNDFDKEEHGYDEQNILEKAIKSSFKDLDNVKKQLNVVLAKTYRKNNKESFRCPPPGSNYSGIGAKTLCRETNKGEFTFTITEVTDGLPAANHGLMEGDKIVIKNCKSMNDAASKLRDTFNKSQDVCIYHKEKKLNLKPVPTVALTTNENGKPKLMKFYDLGKEKNKSKDCVI